MNIRENDNFFNIIRGYYNNKYDIVNKFILNFFVKSRNQKLNEIVFEVMNLSDIFSDMNLRKLINEDLLEIEIINALCIDEKRFPNESEAVILDIHFKNLEKY